MLRAVWMLDESLYGNTSSKNARSCVGDFIEVVICCFAQRLQKGHQTQFSIIAHWPVWQVSLPNTYLQNQAKISWKQSRNWTKCTLILDQCGQVDQRHQVSFSSIGKGSGSYHLICVTPYRFFRGYLMTSNEVVCASASTCAAVGSYGGGSGGATGRRKNALDLVNTIDLVTLDSLHQERWLNWHVENFVAVITQQQL